MKKISFSYFIERYNAGEMSDYKKQWFEEKLDGDVKLRNEVNLRQRTDEILENQNIISLRTKLAMVERSRAAARHSRQTKSPAYLKFAAAIVGIAIIGSISLLFDKNMSSDDIINRYYKVYEPPTAQRSVRSETNDDFTAALAFYNNRDFGKAAALFNKVVESNPRDMQSELLVGLSNFEDKKYPEAKKSFSRVIDDNNNFFIETAKWFLALCYVSTDEREKAIQQFEIIRKEDGIYSSDAKKIIKSYKGSKLSSHLIPDPL